jgi:hypothetical protein
MIENVTLLISYHSPTVLLQASDLLLSAKADRRPVNLDFSKAVVYGGCAGIAFTGVAVVERTSTPDWMCRVLAQTGNASLSAGIRVLHEAAEKVDIGDEGLGFQVCGWEIEPDAFGILTAKARVGLIANFLDESGSYGSVTRGQFRGLWVATGYRMGGFRHDAQHLMVPLRMFFARD